MDAAVKRVVMAAAVLAVVLTGCGQADETATAAATETAEPMGPVEAAMDGSTCQGGSHATVGDEGASLFLDGASDAGTDGLEPDDLGCYLGALDVPDSVLQRMANTRALDGMQDATWGDITATWTYHPDNGLDIIVEESTQ